ncbi:PGPGW domain-containing protein [Cellulomonas sp. P22]|uniref:PGPGW domain-containing protein n=1 Tax=Cellulomonas sp. P22 TaxID=3373189 RepID=UPI0037BDE4D6
MNSTHHEPENGLPARIRTALSALPKPIRWVAVAVVGSALVLAGIAMLVLPGPGWLAIFAGLAVLAAEFTWAATLLGRMRSVATRLWTTVRGWIPRRTTGSAEPDQAP